LRNAIRRLRQANRAASDAAAAGLRVREEGEFNPEDNWHSALFFLFLYWHNDLLSSTPSGTLFGVCVKQTAPNMTPPD